VRCDGERGDGERVRGEENETEELKRVLEGEGERVEALCARDLQTTT
jgi:hypothetical protein